MFTTVLMIEKALSDADVELVATLHGEEQVAFHVLMEPRGRQDELLRALDDVAIGRIDEALHERGEAGTAATAGAVLDRTLGQLREAGAVSATGRVVEGHPLDALRAAVEEHSADEVVVLTAPHFVEEFFHRDWASRARHKVGVPVLKLFAQEP